ncbi:MAG: cell division ATP-binding protein FtsE [Clostridiales bacterium]|nr:cell division ATP-binding protein FtsE [Clostridiales bacterium]
MIEMKNIKVRYSGGIAALNDVNLRIDDGEFVFIVGNSGAGKSTLMKLMLREIIPNEGRVFVNGYNLSKLKGKKIAHFRRTIGVVFQDFRLIPDLTVYDNIAFVLRVTNRSKKYIRQRVPYLLSLVNLADRAKAYPHQLSGGEQQRVALARALANDPPLLIADEPTGNIDPELSYEIVDMLKTINDQGTTVVMVTHQHDLVKYFGGRIINLKRGQISFDELIGGSDEVE